MVSGENTEEVPKSHKRRPTISVKKPKSSSIAEESIAVEIEVEDAQKVEEDGEVKEKRASPMVTKKAKVPVASIDLGKTYCIIILSYPGFQRLVLLFILLLMKRLDNNISKRI